MYLFIYLRLWQPLVTQIDKEHDKAENSKENVLRQSEHPPPSDHNLAYQGNSRKCRGLLIIIIIIIIQIIIIIINNIIYLFN